jgi:hypothetical protein
MNEYTTNLRSGQEVLFVLWSFWWIEEIVALLG